MFVASVRERARQSVRRIVFPESADERVWTAVRGVASAGIAIPIVVLDPSAPATHPLVRDLGAEIVDPASDPRVERLAQDLLQRRAHKGLTKADAERLSRHPLFLADDLVLHGEADGCVAGCVYTTGDVLRAALWLIGPAPGVRTISSAFYMAVGPFRSALPEVLTFTDCAVVPYPSAEQLADIAIAAARDRARIVGDQARVAMLSFSTRGSASGESIDRVRAALELVRARAPDVAIDGEMQADAALIEKVATRKAFGSPVAGASNVLVFPSLDAGNIAYKLTERLAGATAIGPIVQGLAKPCSDLSRGASADDIINVAAITALQAGRSARDDISGDGS
jgi:phosphate acetyltransferase